MTARRLFIIAAVLVATSAAAQTFYSERLQRGIANYNRGIYPLAAQELRVAAFGLIDSPADYETALMYEVAVNEKLQRTDDAALAAEKIVHVEKVVPTYAQVRIDPAVRAAFEAAAPHLLTAEQLAKTPALAHLASRSTVPGKPSPVTPRPQAVAPPPPAAQSLAVEAYARLQSGDDAGARDLATKATVDDYTNALAHTVLALLAGRAGDWNGVAEHYSVVRTRRHLDADENVAYYNALVRLGRTADAAGVERILPPAVRSRLPQPAATSTAATPPAPAPRAAGSAPFVARSDAMTALAAADQLLRAGNVAGARDAYLRLAGSRDLTRELALSVARGLYQTGAYRASSAQYQKLYPLKPGEELHMFYEAVNRYEMGDYSIAKLLMTRAAPSLPKTPQVELYRKRIESAH